MSEITLVEEERQTLDQLIERYATELLRSRALWQLEMISSADGAWEPRKEIVDEIRKSDRDLQIAMAQIIVALCTTPITLHGLNAKIHAALSAAEKLWESNYNPITEVLR